MTPKTIILKRDTEEKFKEYNPILQDHELVCVKFDDGTIKYKLGDNKTFFIDLPYIDKISDIEYINVYDRYSRVHMCRIYLNGFIFDNNQ